MKIYPTFFLPLYSEEKDSRGYTFFPSYYDGEKHSKSENFYRTKGFSHTSDGRRACFDDYYISVPFISDTYGSYLYSGISSSFI